MVSVRVTKIRFSDGQEVTVPSEGMVLLVGPNNAGKSQTLKDLIGLVRNSQHAGRTLSSVEYMKSRLPDIREWAIDNLPKVFRDGMELFDIDGWTGVSGQNLYEQWIQPDLSVLTSLFIFHADGTSRLTAGDSQPNIDFSMQSPNHPVQRAYLDPTLEKEMDRESRATFGLGVTVDRFGGSVISLRVGDKPIFKHNNGPPSSEYLAALKALPKLEEQGDGVRSYLGLVLHLAAGKHQILLVDEPEAFLHPPQARRLGSVLANKAQSQQAFIATHSTDVVQGALEGEAPVTIIRVTRNGDENHPAVLDDSAVKKLWADPLLRYSNVLDGLFHDAVILCESDADCRYYSAVLDHIQVIRKDQTVSREPQYLFTHCGGKARMSSVVDALRAVSVPVVVVADFDVLRNATDVNKIVTSLGGDYSQFEKDLQLVAGQLTQDEKPLRKLTLRDELNQKIDLLPNQTVDSKDAESLRAVIKAESGWDKAKRSGTQAVPQGDASAACRKLLTGLQNVGLFVVPVGELERFVPGVPGHGPAWVSAVLEQKLHETPGEDALRFEESIRDSVKPPSRPQETPARRGRPVVPRKRHRAKARLQP